MLHFSCDLCGRHLDDHRFVVKLEVFPSFDPDEIEESDLEADHLQEVAEELDKMEMTGQTEIEDCEARDFRFDLCPACRRKFLEDPLGRDATRRLNFSEN
ncbi:MAG: hypothetical protein Tsb009_01710 [Planctomycetaceae bacterium]